MCPYCQNQHINSVEQEICPMRTEQVPLMVEQFGPLASGKYQVTDRVTFDWKDNGGVCTGVVLWIIGPGSIGSKIEPSPNLRYLIEPDGYSDGLEVNEKDMIASLLPSTP